MKWYKRRIIWQLLYFYSTFDKVNISLANIITPILTGETVTQWYENQARNSKPHLPYSLKSSAAKKKKLVWSTLSLQFNAFEGQPPWRTLWRAGGASESAFHDALLRVRSLSLPTLWPAPSCPAYSLRQNINEKKSFFGGVSSIKNPSGFLQRNTTIPEQQHASNAHDTTSATSVRCCCCVFWQCLLHVAFDGASQVLRCYHSDRRCHPSPWPGTAWCAQTQHHSWGDGEGLTFPSPSNVTTHHLRFIPVKWWALKKSSLAWLSGWTNLKISGHTYPSSSLGVQTGNCSIVTNLRDGRDGNSQIFGLVKCLWVAEEWGCSESYRHWALKALW